MAIRDILLHVPVELPAVALDAAILLAQKHQARLTALYTARPSISAVLPPEAIVGLPPMVLAESDADTEKRRIQAKSDFEEKCTRTQVPFEWREATGDWYGAVIDCARYADILVIGATGDASPAGQSSSELVLRCGRPVLLVPRDHTGIFGRRILVAWNRTREASRALHDAVPLLQQAEIVRVLSVVAAHDEHIPSAEITAHLARHRIKAEAATLVRPAEEAADALLLGAKSFHADMMVMGAWGHSRLRELVFGGVTRRMLTDPPMPVLFSH